jgi:hypothetical protein
VIVCVASIFSNSLKTRRGIIMRTIKFLLAILFSLAVVACGGGGGYGGGGMGGGGYGGGIYSISGNVKFSGSNLLGATIALSGTRATSTTTDMNGNYSFTGLPNGSYTVKPSGFGYTYTPISTPVTISGNNPTGINFTSP